MRLHTAMLCVLILPAVTGAQLIPPIPEATPATPEYTPPPPPEPPAPPPEETQPPTAALQGAIPSLVERDAKGALVPLEQSAERAAIARLELTEEQRDRYAAAELERSTELESKIIANLPVLLSLRESVKGLDQNSDFGQLVSLRDKATPVLPSGTLLDFLSRQGAITAHQKRLVEQAVKEYEEARRADWMESHGGDIMAVSTALVRDKLRQQLSEPMSAFDSMVRAAAERGREFKPDGLSGAAQASLGGVMKEGEKLPPAQRIERFRSWFLGLESTGDQQAVLRAVARAPAALESTEPAQTAPAPQGSR